MQYEYNPEELRPFNGTLSKVHAGWTNYETWAVAEMMHNNRRLSVDLRATCLQGEEHKAAQALKERTTDTFEGATLKVTVPETAQPREQLRAACEDLASLGKMLLLGALAQVNWLEIVRFEREENAINPEVCQ